MSETQKALILLGVSKLFNSFMNLFIEEKEFSCSVCFKKFRLKHHLKGHNRIHTLDKPFQCLHCGKCFTENSSLSRHTKIHTNDKKFACQQCGKQFIASAELRKHMVIIIFISLMQIFTNKKLNFIFTGKTYW